MHEMWNKRYKGEDYVYGREPNNYLRCELIKIDPGIILFPAEGEGRNAVFAASIGWEVHAFDYSETGKTKALKLASENKVQINYKLASYEEMDYNQEQFDCIALIYAHQPSQQRKATHQKLINYLKPGGIIILEAYSKEQLKYNTGGPKDVDMLFSKEELQNDFESLSSYDISVVETNISEGLLHVGKSSVIRMTGIK